MPDYKLVNDIFELCSLKLNDRFNSFSRLQDSSLHETQSEDGLESIDYRSEVLLLGADITIRIQLFYGRIFFTPYLKNIYNTATQEQVIDFFNEVANLTGGKVKEVFFEQGIVVALSLPMSTGTKISKITSRSEPLTEHKIFESRYMGQNIYMAKISFDIYSPGSFFSFDKNLSKLGSQEGEVEFF